MDIRYMVRTVSWDKRRAENVRVLQQQIPQLEIHVDTQHNGYQSFFDACEKINETGAVLMEDDIEVCHNFCQKVERILFEKGTDKVYNFFERPKSYFKTSYVGGSNFLWMQCIYLPPGLPGKIKLYYDNFYRERPKKWIGMATDCLLSYVLVKEKIKYWRIRPCLVQHLDFRSVIDKRRPNNRQSPYYIELLKQQGITYEDLQPPK